jgi:hypothetical protein
VEVRPSASLLGAAIRLLLRRVGGGGLVAGDGVFDAAGEAVDERGDLFDPKWPTNSPRVPGSNGR